MSGDMLSRQSGHEQYNNFEVGYENPLHASLFYVFVSFFLLRLST